MSCWDLNIRVSCDEICFDLHFEGCHRFESVGVMDAVKEKHSNKTANIS